MHAWQLKIFGCQMCDDKKFPIAKLAMIKIYPSPIVQ
jgi:hypothetical protein